jgi:hypothetical protein
MGYDVRLVHKGGECWKKAYVSFAQISEVDREVMEFEVDADDPPACDSCGKGILVPTYDEVSEWWDNSDYAFSTYPPSAWHKYMEREGIGMTKLLANPAKVEEGVEEMVSDGDGRTCECQWSAHEKGCTWSPHEGHTGKWGRDHYWECETEGCDQPKWYDD